MKSALLVPPLLLILLEACSSPVYLEDLTRPALAWNRARGLCGSWIAVDADGGLWRGNDGCENDNGRSGLKAAGKGDPTKVEALRQAFQTLPVNAGPQRSDCLGNLFTFSRWTAATKIESRACALGSSYDDLTGLEEPHLTVARGFLALP